MSAMLSLALLSLLTAAPLEELFVKVDKDWQSRPGSLERLGY